MLVLVRFRDLLIDFLLQNFQYAGGVWAIESLHFEVSKLVWTMLTLVLTLFRYRSSFLTMFWVLCPLIGRTILERTYDKTAIQKKDKGKLTKVKNSHISMELFVLFQIGNGSPCTVSLSPSPC